MRQKRLTTEAPRSHRDTERSMLPTRSFGPVSLLTRLGLVAQRNDELDVLIAGNQFDLNSTGRLFAVLQSLRQVLPPDVSRRTGIRAHYYRAGTQDKCDQQHRRDCFVIAPLI